MSKLSSMSPQAMAAKTVDERQHIEQLTSRCQKQLTELHHASGVYLSHLSHWTSLPQVIEAFRVNHKIESIQPFESDFAHQVEKCCDVIKDHVSQLRADRDKNLQLRALCGLADQQLDRLRDFSQLFYLKRCSAEVEEDNPQKTLLTYALKQWLLLEPSLRRIEDTLTQIKESCLRMVK